MKLFKVFALAVAFCLTTPLWASTTTIYGGFEDTTGSGSDYDYNDLVFSISGNGLTLNSTGQWFNPSGLVLGTSGSPFWNNASSDGPNYNIGYCMYGGGSCNGGVALDSNGDYLATSTGGSVNDVYFSLPSVGSGVDTTITLSISADTDTLGWALVSNPTVVHALGGVGSYSFTPGGNFELVGIVNGSTDYYSDSGSGVSQFAFFASTPEPSSFMLLGSSLLGAAGMLRRRMRMS